MSTEKSIKALKESKEVRSTCKRKILTLLEKESLRTDELIDKLPEYAKSTITGRISDLNDEGHITPSKEFANETNKTLYRLTYSSEREIIAEQRKKERFNQWLKNSVEFEDWMPTEVMRWIQLDVK